MELCAHLCVILVFFLEHWVKPMNSVNLPWGCALDLCYQTQKSRITDSLHVLSFPVLSFVCLMQLAFLYSRARMRQEISPVIRLMLVMSPFQNCPTIASWLITIRMRRKSNKLSTTEEKRNIVCSHKVIQNK